VSTSRKVNGVAVSAVGPPEESRLAPPRIYFVEPRRGLADARVAKISSGRLADAEKFPEGALLDLRDRQRKLVDDFGRGRRIFSVVNESDSRAGREGRTVGQPRSVVPVVLPAGPRLFPFSILAPSNDDRRRRNTVSAVRLSNSLTAALASTSKTPQYRS